MLELALWSWQDRILIVDVDSPLTAVTLLLLPLLWLQFLQPYSCQGTPELSAPHLAEQSALGLTQVGGPLAVASPGRTESGVQGLVYPWAPQALQFQSFQNYSNT